MTPICVWNSTKNPGWVLPGKLGGGVLHASWNSYSMSDENLWSDLIKNLIPYFRPEDLEPVAGPERERSCYGTYTVGVNIKREMVLSPNDEEIASSKKHTQFKTRVHKPYLISDQNGRNWYPNFRPKRLKNHTFWRRTCLYSLYKVVLPPGRAKNALQNMSLAPYASETNEVNLTLTFTKRLGY